MLIFPLGYRSCDLYHSVACDLSTIQRVHTSIVGTTKKRSATVVNLNQSGTHNVPPSIAASFVPSSSTLSRNNNSTGSVGKTLTNSNSNNNVNNNSADTTSVTASTPQQDKVMIDISDIYK